MNKINPKNPKIRNFMELSQEQPPWDTFKSWMNQHCVFSDKDLNNSVCFFLFDKILSALIKHDRVEYLLEVAKLAVPSNDGAPWVLKEKADIAKLRLLVQEMETSKLFNASAAPKPKVSKPKAKPQAKGKPAGRGRPSKPGQRVQQQVSDVADDVGEKFEKMTAGRKTTFIDDVLNAVMFTTENVPAEKHVPKFNSRIVAWCFEFECEGSVVLPDLD
eukprot:9192514-Pyramimonas_sp.AAC.1